MLPKNQEKMLALVSASAAVNHPYEIIDVRGRKILITRASLKLAIHNTWERLYDPETAELAKELGIELRKIKGVVDCVKPLV